MTWRRVADLFDAALDVPSGEHRKRYVAEVARDDAALGQELERWLAADEGSCDVLDQPPFRLGNEAPEMPEMPEMPEIGPYRILDVLGEGGMSIVYLASRDDTDFQRRVAIKVVRRDLPGRVVRQRFLAERQFLAQLEHPHIARLYDVGTTADGRPYLVMEAVRGQTILDYCDDRMLTVDDRLRLVLQLMDAVTYAHQRLLIHRDIKPSNVLVTSDGVVKLLDFGIAKWLSHDGCLASKAPHDTTRGERWLTPSYASPEQVRGAAHSTATDVYSIGVLLYELLVGCLPYRLHGTLPHELEQAICQQPAQGPSRALARRASDLAGIEVARLRGQTEAELRRRLIGDLDSILLKALRKEPEQRYGSVEQMAEDLRRHLQQLPVRARVGEWGYQSGKFVSRHSRGLAVAVLFVVSVAGLSAELGRRGEVLARERQQREAMARDLTELIIRPGEAPQAQRDDLLQLAVPRLRAELRRQQIDESSVLGALGRVYHQAGFASRAVPLIAESLQLQRQGQADDQRSDERNNERSQASEVAASLHDLGVIEVENGRLAEGLELLETALEQRREQSGVGVSESLEALALVRWQQGEFGLAEAQLLASLQSRDEACPVDSYWAAEGLSHLAALYSASGRWQEAAQFVRQASDRRAAVGEHRADQAQSLEDEAMLASSRGDYGKAVAQNRRALALRRLDVKEASTIDAERKLASSLHQLARSLGEQGDYEEAKQLFLESLELERRWSSEPAPAVATLLNNLAVVLGRKGEVEAAAALLDQVLAMRLQLLGPSHPHVAQVYYSQGSLRHDAGDLDGAIELYRIAALGLGDLPPTHPAHAYPQVAIGRWLLDYQRPAEAEPILRSALAHLRQHLAAGHWRIAEAESLLGHAWQLQEEADAERAITGTELMRRSAATLEAVRGRHAPKSRQARARLGELPLRILAPRVE